MKNRSIEQLRRLQGMQKGLLFVNAGALLLMCGLGVFGYLKSRQIVVPFVTLALVISVLTFSYNRVTLELKRRNDA